MLPAHRSVAAPAGPASTVLGSLACHRTAGAACLRRTSSPRRSSPEARAAIALLGSLLRVPTSVATEAVTGHAVVAPPTCVTSMRPATTQVSTPPREVLAPYASSTSSNVGKAMASLAIAAPRSATPSRGSSTTLSPSARGLTVGTTGPRKVAAPSSAEGPSSPVASGMPMSRSAGRRCMP